MIKRLLIICCIGLFLGLQSCKEKPEPQLDVTDINAILLYAVNNNNLSGDFIANRNQILKAADQYDPDKDFIYVYGYENGGGKLKKLVFNDSGAEFVEVKNYGAGSYSTTQERISEVIHDFENLVPANRRTLFLWGHGLGPVNPQKYYRLNSQLQSVYSVSPEPITIEQPECYAYGGEYPNNDFIDLDQLADAIPDGLFDTIWFDCCYMGSIEIAYQLRNDCKYFVAYPTEIWSDGLPYNSVMPFLTGGNYNLVEGAKALYNYYAISRKAAVTVAVMDMSKLQAFAESCKELVSQIKEKPSYDGVINFSRLYLSKPNNYIPHPYYDLMGWLNNCKANDNQTLTQALRKATLDFENFVNYKATYTVDFKNQTIDPNNFCGLSVYDFNNDGSERDTYYQKLDWYKDVVSYSGWLTTQK